MKKWSESTEEFLTILIKDWLKQQGRSQSDLRDKLQADSSRMPALLEVLQREYLLGGFPRVVNRLCSIESLWSQPTQELKDNSDLAESDPFSQLDLLLEEMRNNSNL
tara:strand:- start:536 stop:856 length:321 start_codon:yes stop_codon:yes gene_type:complete